MRTDLVSAIFSPSDKNNIRPIKQCSNRRRNLVPLRCQICMTHVPETDFTLCNYMFHGNPCFLLFTGVIDSKLLSLFIKGKLYLTRLLLLEKLIYMVGQKGKPVNFCNNFVYCKPVFVIFGTCRLH